MARSARKTTTVEDKAVKTAVAAIGDNSQGAVMPTEEQAVRYANEAFKSLSESKTISGVAEQQMAAAAIAENIIMREARPDYPSLVDYRGDTPADAKRKRGMLKDMKAKFLVILDEKLEATIGSEEYADVKESRGDNSSLVRVGMELACLLLRANKSLRDFNEATGQWSCTVEELCEPGQTIGEKTPREPIPLDGKRRFGVWTKAANGTDLQVFIQASVKQFKRAADPKPVVTREAGADATPGTGEPVMVDLKDKAKLVEKIGDTVSPSDIACALLRAMVAEGSKDAPEGWVRRWDNYSTAAQRALQKIAMFVDEMKAQEEKDKLERAHSQRSGSRAAA
jgi:hypothetical protein